MDITITHLFTIIISYCIGSVLSAVLLARLCGVADPRHSGSGNPGATNILRYGGKKLAAAVLLLDALKGVAAVLLARALGLETHWIFAAGAAAFVGHVLPLYFRFRGGKGVATLLGVMTAFDWRIGLAMVATWLGCAALTRYSSLSAIVASLLSPLLLWWWYDDLWLTTLGLLMAALLWWRHRVNIQRLLTGTESKLFSR